MKIEKKNRSINPEHEFEYILLRVNNMIPVGNTIGFRKKIIKYNYLHQRSATLYI